MKSLKPASKIKSIQVNFEASCKCKLVATKWQLICNIANIITCKLSDSATQWDNDKLLTIELIANSDTITNTNSLTEVYDVNLNFQPNSTEGLNHGSRTTLL